MYEQYICKIKFDHGSNVKVKSDSDIMILQIQSPITPFCMAQI